MTPENDYDLTDGDLNRLMAKSDLFSRLLSPVIEVDPEKWTEVMETENSRVQAEMEKALGPTFFKFGIFPLATSAHLLGIFPEDSEPPTNIGIVQVCVGIGYQLENIDDCAMVLNEVLRKLVETSLLTQPEDQRDSDKLGAAIYGFLMTGSYWKSIVTGKDIEDDTPDVFRDFFQGKLDGI